MKANKMRVVSLVDFQSRPEHTCSSCPAFQSIYRTFSGSDRQHQVLPPGERFECQPRTASCHLRYVYLISTILRREAPDLHMYLKLCRFEVRPTIAPCVSHTDTLHFSQVIGFSLVKKRTLQSVCRRGVSLTALRRMLNMYRHHLSRHPHPPPVPVPASPCATGAVRYTGTVRGGRPRLYPYQPLRAPYTGTAHGG